MDKRDRPLVPVLTAAALYFFGSGYLSVRIALRMAERYLPGAADVSRAENLGHFILKIICFFVSWAILLLIGWLVGWMLMDKYLPPPKG